MFAEFMNAYGMEIIATVLTAVLGTIGMAIKHLAQRYLDTRDKQALALTAVRFVEQVYKDLHGHEKLCKAYSTLTMLLEEHGIACSAKEMEAMVEAAVNEMNSQGGFFLGEPVEIAKD